VGFPFLKGHGTENDFIVLPDPDGSRHGELSDDLVRRLCDRRTGLGADGVLRAIRCTSYDEPAAVAAREHAEWFMDYRNADGSAAQMCGNGIRVFGRYLADHEGADTSRPLPVGTRDGVKWLRFDTDGQVSVDMGGAEVLGETKVAVGSRGWPAIRVRVGNPHAVAFVDTLADAGPLTEAPSYSAVDFPEGVNVEFVVRRGARHLAMRVHERGAGETRSCGTGAVAVAAAASAIARGGVVATESRGTGKVVTNDTSGAGSDVVADHFSAARPGAASSGETWRVDVPGGTLTITLHPDGTAVLTGPAVLVAGGEDEVW
jgi:diaminopimelate epimerase